jgi:hypothetical protein
VGFSHENPLSITKKQKPAPSVATKNEEHLGVPGAEINQVAPFITSVMQADINNLEAKLPAS